VSGVGDPGVQAGEDVNGELYSAGSSMRVVG
jgi:hypothetical protein